MSPFESAFRLLKAPMWYGDGTGGFERDEGVEQEPPYNPDFTMLEDMKGPMDPSTFQQAWESEDGLSRGIAHPDHEDGNWKISHFEVADDFQGLGSGETYLQEFIDRLREDEEIDVHWNPYEVHVTQVDPPANGFWNKMVDRGVIHAAHETPWIRRTLNGDSTFSHAYTQHHQKPYKAQMKKSQIIAKDDRTLDEWTRKLTNKKYGLKRNDEPYRAMEMSDWGEDDYGGREEVEDSKLDPILTNWKGDRAGKIGHGANRYALIGDKTVEKIPQNYGRGSSKASMAMLNALASLGYPIAPEKAIAPSKNIAPRFFPVQQEKLDRTDADYSAFSGIGMTDAEIRERNDKYEKFHSDLDDLGFQLETESKLGSALDLGDIAANEENVAYKDGKLMAIDPFVGNQLDLGRLGTTLSDMAGPQKGTQNYDKPSLKRPVYDRDYRKIIQGFDPVDPMQFNSFMQLYRDKEQFSPWEEAERKLFNNPDSFGESAPNPEQQKQLALTLEGDDDQYGKVGDALDWINTPNEQRRLFEFGDNEHARRYRNMMAQFTTRRPGEYGEGNPEYQPPPI